jgi:hypothetical protein
MPYSVVTQSRWAPAFTGFLLGLLFSPHSGGDMFLENMGLSLNCKVFEPGRQMLLNFTSRCVLACQLNASANNI